MEQKDKLVPPDDTSTDIYFSNTIISEYADINDKVTTTEYSYVSKDKALQFQYINELQDSQLNEFYSSIRTEKIALLSLNKEYPKEMEQLTKLPLIYDDTVVYWNKQILDNDIYIGECHIATQKRQGRGCYMWNNGTKYIGYWNDNNKNGKGRMYYANGKLIYEGDYVEGKKCGKGVYYFESGERYEGMFLNDQFNGKGRMYYTNGKLEYEGDYVEEKKFGKRVYYFENCTKYEGEFKDDEYIGEKKEIVQFFKMRLKNMEIRKLIISLRMRIIQIQRKITKKLIKKTIIIKKAMQMAMVTIKIRVI